ncbi:hypothetical protein RM717_09140 [Streptomyces griseus]|uniref:Integral membrane protein n=1 Tax=Streptomyces stephensoniae TaxID=3375367 RepID=A0ABU2VYK4_9ACTN|nr:hypothetical protein [Streptomyces griseus]MDT0490669.1 hypothetical protein [Streptomyces griseus]
MTPPAGPPPLSGRRRTGLGGLLRPRSSRTFVLGLCMSVGGLGGGVRAAMDGEGIWRALGISGVGLLGLALTVAWVVTYARER